MTYIKDMRLYDFISSIVKNHLEYSDCDGCIRVVAYLLKLAGIKFKIWTGIISRKDNGKEFPIHYWVETKDGQIWDFKSYKWLQKESDDCNYKKKQDVTDTFIYDIETFRIMILLSNSIGKKQDKLYEKVTGSKLYRKIKILK